MNDPDPVPPGFDLSEWQSRPTPATAGSPGDGSALPGRCLCESDEYVCDACCTGAEFLCMVCGGWFGFLAPTAVEPTPEVDARYAELRARFDAGERPQ